MAVDEMGAGQTISPPAARAEYWQRATEWAMPFMALVYVGLAAFQIYTYLTSWLWQSLVVAGGMLVALVLVIVAYWIWRRQLPGSAYSRAAGYLLLAALVVAGGSGQLAFDGVTLELFLAGAAALLLIAILFFQTHVRVWLASVLVYGLLLVAINLVEPIDRVTGARDWIISIELVLGAIVAAFFGILVLARSIMGTGTIRERLLISFVSLVLLPVLLVSIGMVVGGLRSDRLQAVGHLQSVAILKQAEIETWTNDLHADLAMALVGDEVIRQALVLLEGDGDPSTFDLAQDVVRTRFDQTILETRRYQELLLLDLDGRVVVSTNPLHEGDVRGNQTYFTQGLQGPSLQSPRYSPSTMSTSVFAAHPVANPQGVVQGVLVGQASLERLTEIMLERTGLGETGETYLVGEPHTLLTPSRTGRVHVGVYSDGINAAVDTKVNGSGLYRNNEGVAVVGAYRWLPSLEVGLVAEREQAEAFRDTFVTLGVAGAVALIAAAVAVGVSLMITRSIATPIASLAESATRIAGGDLRSTAKERLAFQRSHDEVGMLARAFYSMTDQLQDLIGGLEGRVAERTRELERRSTYLEAAAQVGSAVSSVLDSRLLLQQVVDVIRTEFDLYYVGLFLVDEAREWATLHAATGVGGKALLDRGHRLAVAENSMVGWSVIHGEARLARYAEQDDVRLATPELPETRSEVALPLRSRGRIIGALSVQHGQPDAFDADSLVVLQAMADQVAGAVDNARLFAERQQALDMAQRAYGELSRDAWADILRTRTDLGFLSDRDGVVPAAVRMPAEAEQALLSGQTTSRPAAGSDTRHVLAVPIRVRGQVVGVIDTYKPAQAGEWTPEEIALLERIAEEMDPALESARLYQDTQRRAARERVIRQVTDRMRRSVEIESILESTIVELAQALGAPRVYVRLGTGNEQAGAVTDGPGQGAQAGKPVSAQAGKPVGAQEQGARS